MPTFKELVTQVDEYHKRYRNRSLEKFKDGGVYDLFPTSTEPTIECKFNWLKDEYPYKNVAGVYSFLSEDLKVLYIGETDNFYGRMVNYLRGSIQSGCKFKDRWVGSPRYVHFYIAPNESKFETPALEAYLIIKIETPNNKTVKYR